MSAEIESDLAELAAISAGVRDMVLARMRSLPQRTDGRTTFLWAFVGGAAFLLYRQPDSTLHWFATDAEQGMAMATDRRMSGPLNLAAIVDRTNPGAN